MTVLHPITRAWLSTGGTGAQNYDEFADEAEITAIVKANPDSALAIEMPHTAPESLGRSFDDCLEEAARRLRRNKEAGRYAPANDVIALYRINSPAPATEPAYGMFCMVDTDQISTSADEPGLVIRNEEVFLEKVYERVALATATGHLLSPVLLLQTADGDQLHNKLVDACEAAGDPVVTDVDHAGRTHQIWLLPPGPRQDELRELGGAGELVVADGNHRSLAAQTGRLPRFLAVVTTPDSVTIQPYNRLVTESTTTPEELIGRLVSAGAQVTSQAGRPAMPADNHLIHLYATGRSWAVTLPAREGASLVDNLDHSLVERLVLRNALGLDPEDKRVTYVGGDYQPGWLCDEVDAGRAELAIFIAPVSVADFVAVNLARLKLPRKSTWFTPKARAGLVLAEL